MHPKDNIWLCREDGHVRSEPRKDGTRYCLICLKELNQKEK